MEHNQILCGDATIILSQYAAECVDLVITDPPYLCRYKDRDGRTLANDDNPDAVLAVFEEAYRVLKPDSYCISFYGWNAIAAFSQAWAKAGFTTVGHIVWPKRYASRSGHTQYRHESAFVLTKGWPPKPEQPISDVQEWAYSGNKYHPTEKAVSVIAPLVRGFSKRGDLVLDPFSGSGSTAVAAALNGRDYLGIELEERYCNLARARLKGVSRYQEQRKAA
ncbi:DNA methyltransferase [Novosphingobium beihaiensis]|uniref:Methyltransferase n=1 Tax=Novosphingobium beihaiensis TaxID=2930389 RepID=A0ABT0BME3_9SPHN|nr:DNA methyltransferase [Novosphingobium beihaiensis]MCJ2186231.1 DNA methyltransferase [Novosphingobium beihaiensis]